MSRPNPSEFMRVKVEAKNVGKTLVSNRAGGLLEFDRYISRINDSTTGVNILAVIQQVMMESIKETANDKKLHLQKLRRHNDMAQQLSELLEYYLKELSDVNRELAAEDAGGKGAGGKGSCDPSRPSRIIARIEKARSQLEEAIKKVNPRDRQRPEIRMLLEQVAHEKKVIDKAKATYASAFKKR